MPDSRIYQIEELAANAWRPDIEQSLDGWRLRFNQGINRRCNSVWPNQVGGNIELEERISLVDKFYRRWKIRPRYQLCLAAQPSNLAEILAARGYTEDAHTAVEIAPIEKVHSSIDSESEFTLDIEEELSSDWFEFHVSLEGLSEQSAKLRQGTLSRIGPQSAFVTLRLDNQRVALGLGVFEKDWVGVFCMATHPQYQRRGAATAILGALANWGSDHGADQMYLQVMENNPSALALYARAGFEKLYQYYYAEGPVK